MPKRMTNQEAIEILNTMLEEGRYLGNESHIPLEVLETFDKAKKALEKQKVGHWIKYCRPRCGEQHYQCTSCGYYINFGQWGEVYTKQFKYCPNCCARMEGEQE